MEESIYEDVVTVTRVVKVF